MKKYKEIILNKLIDKYERSSLYKEINKKNINISYSFNVKNMKDYFDETNYENFEEINIQCKEIEYKSFIIIEYGKGYENHIIKKVTLNMEKLHDIYIYLNRTKKKDVEEKAIEILSKYVDKNNLLCDFSKYLIEKLQKKESVKKYIDINNKTELEHILMGVDKILSMEKEIFKRILSMQLYGDSKKLEKLENKILKIINDFGCEKIDDLSECNVLNNYAYVYIKGDITLKLYSEKINVKEFKGGLGISSKDIENIQVLSMVGKKLVTIENLTTFNNYHVDDEIVVYLGGYHNEIRRNLLLKIFRNSSDIDFYHWGDIDIGGFRIWKHLVSKTNIPFKTYMMNKDTLIEYENYAKELTDRDKKSLKLLIEDDFYKDYRDLFKYMIEKSIKLEQEIIECTQI